MHSLPRSSRPLRILVVVLYYYPYTSGLTVYAQMVAEGLAERGHEVTVLAAKHDQGAPLGESQMNGVRVVRSWAPLRVSRGRIMPNFPWRLLRLLRGQDIVYVHTPSLESGPATWFARLNGTPVVATHHSDLILPKGRVNGMIERCMRVVFDNVAPHVDCIVSSCADYAGNSAYLSPKHLDKVRTIYPPIDIPCPRPEKARALRQQWKRNGGPLIGFSGRFVEEKRPDLLIRALEVINVKYPDTRVLFTGVHEIDYEDTWERLRELIKRFESQLVFLGVLETRQELADFYAACDLFALPSDSEGFAMAQVEAMLCGTPVIMTDIPGGRVPLQTTGMGKLAKPGDAQSIGEAAVAVLDDTARYTKTRDEISRAFSLNDTLNRYEELFLSLAR